MKVKAAGGYKPICFLFVQLLLFGCVSTPFYKFNSAADNVPQQSCASPLPLEKRLRRINLHLIDKYSDYKQRMSVKLGAALDFQGIVAWEDSSNSKIMHLQAEQANCFELNDTRSECKGNGIIAIFPKQRDSNANSTDIALTDIYKVITMDKLEKKIYFFEDKKMDVLTLANLMTEARDLEAKENHQDVCWQNAYQESSRFIAHFGDMMTLLKRNGSTLLQEQTNAVIATVGW